MSERLLTFPEMRSVLRKAVEAAGTQKDFAERHGFSPSYISDCLSGRRAISDALASCIGYERISAFRRLT